MRLVSLAALLAACTPAIGSTEQDSGRVRYHMRQRASDLKLIEGMLLDGKLDDARRLAFSLTRPASMPEAREARDVVLAAGALANARTLDDAIYADARVANACAHCHVAQAKLPVFKTPSSAPPDRPTVAAQMARHRWATDRMWEGIIGASDAHWRAGLYVLATSPLPTTVTTSRPFALQLQERARTALDDTNATLDARTDTYAELLIICAGCHATR